MTAGGGGARGALVESFERRRRHPTHDPEAAAAAAWADLSASGALLLPEAVRLDDAVDLHDLGGDSHSGAFPVLVTWPDGQSWIHKPRSSWQEALVGELLEAAGRALGLPWQRPEIRSDGSRSWVRPSEHLPVADLDGVREFFCASGVLLAVAHVLRLGDLNHENIIASGARPVVVDAELLCRPGPPRLVAPAARPARAAFESSVLGTLMLPLTADPAEPSGLGVAAASRARTAAGAHPGIFPCWTAGAGPRQRSWRRSSTATPLRTPFSLTSCPSWRSVCWRAGQRRSACSSVPPSPTSSR